MKGELFDRPRVEKIGVGSFFGFASGKRISHTQNNACEMYVITSDMGCLSFFFSLLKTNLGGGGEEGLEGFFLSCVFLFVKTWSDGKKEKSPGLSLAFLI